MSGPIVPMIGGPKDGMEAHRNSSLREQEMLYEAGPYQSGGRELHVYRSISGRAPFRYQGTRRSRPDDVVLPLYVGRSRMEYDAPAVEG